MPACFLERSRLGVRLMFRCRMAKAVLVGVPHHLTQHGLDREPLFFADANREVYFALIRTAAARFGADLLGYCLMTK
jgi:hypothetical protein